MTWYFWVWGVVSCLGCLALVIGAGLMVWFFFKDNETRDRYKVDAEEWKDKAKYWEKEFEAVQKRCGKLSSANFKLEQQLKCYGPVSP